MTLRIGFRLLLFCLAVGLLAFSCSAKKAGVDKLVEGTWQLLIKTPRGDRTPMVVIDGANSTYEGEPIEVTTDGPKVSFLAAQQAGSLGRMEFTFVGVVDGDTMSGTYTLETGSLKGRSGVFTGERVRK